MKGWCVRFAVMVCVMGLAGCGSFRAVPIDEGAYASRHEEFDVAVGWNTVVESGRIRLDGFARNRRYFIMEDLELQVMLLNQEGAVVARASDFVMPLALRQGERGRFSIVLAPAPRDGASLRVIYRYRAVEGNDMGVSWLNSFEEPLR